MRLSRGANTPVEDSRLPRPSKALLDHLRERFGQSSPMARFSSTDAMLVALQEQAEQRAKLEVLTYLDSLYNGKEG
jgi:hypothetical protein